MQVAVPAADRRWSCQRRESDSRQQTLQSQTDGKEEEEEVAEEGQKEAQE